MDDAQRKAWLRQALQQHERPLLRYALHLLRDPEQARDVVQETFLRLCQTPPETVSDHLAEWLFTVCRNRAIDLLRRRKPTEPLEPTEHTSDRPGPADVAEQRETATQILDIIETLPDKQREVLRLKFQNGMKYQEISRITGFSVSYVGVLIHKAMTTLRAQLAEDAKRSKKKRRAS